MSDYTKATNFTVKDTNNDTVLGAEHDAEYDALATAVATKANKVASATNNYIVLTDAAGDIKDSGVDVATLVVSADIASFASVVGTPTLDNLLSMDAGGDLKDSGYTKVQMDALTGFLSGTKGNLLIQGASGAMAALAVGTDGYHLEADSTEASGLKWATNSGGSGASVAVLQYQEAAAVNSELYTSGAFRTVDLNTEVSDAGSIVTLASKSFTPISGTYKVTGYALLNDNGSSGEYKVRIRNTTQSTTAIVGASGQSGNISLANALACNGVLTADGSDAYQLQVYSTNTTDALDGVASGEVEVYAEVILEKLT